MECRICKLEKTEDQFNLRKEGNRRTECKTCLAAAHKAYREKNKEKLKAKFKEKYWANPKAMRERSNSSYDRHTEKRKAVSRAYYENNKEKALESRLRRQKERVKNDPVYKLKRNLRNRMWYALSNKAWKKSSKLASYLGLESYAELKNFLASTFDSSMTWDNYGDYWDIDHIVPLSLAKTPEHLNQLSHYSNLRAMEKVANRIDKKDNFDFKSEYTVKLITYSEGQEFLLKHHYLKRKAPSEYTFGLYLSNNCLVGVATFATPFSPGLRKLICGPEQELNVIELNRLALKDFLPKNSESWFVSQCLNSGKIKKDILVTFADTAQNHSGTIYRALNFIYTGKTYSTMEYNSPTHSFGAASKSNRAEFGYRKRSVKHRFIYFLRNKKKYQKLLKLPIITYPV